MKRLSLRWLSFPVLVISACADPAAPPADFEVALAKGGPSATLRADFTITDAGLSLVSDGKGTYQDGVCGAWGSFSNDILFLAPGGSKIPKSQQAACANIAPRRATVTLAVKHISDNPHIDDDLSPAGSGVFDVANVKFGFGSAQATTINANSTTFCGSLGLRFTSVTFPGTSDVVRDDLGGGHWQMHTRPWPDNIGYCENNGVVAYWHVSFNLHAQIK